MPSPPKMTLGLTYGHLVSPLWAGKAFGAIEKLLLVMAMHRPSRFG